MYMFCPFAMLRIAMANTVTIQSKRQKQNQCFLAMTNMCSSAECPSSGTLHHHPVIADITPEPSTSQPASRPQMVLLLCVAQQMLLEQSKALDTARMAAFTKSLTCGALHLESRAAMGSLFLLYRLLR